MVDINLKLPEHFLEQEVRDGYTVSQKMKEVWAVELDLLNEFIRVCDKYNIKWFADGGTLLGAVRHKGMIPWDDDIDVMMLREEYDKFLAVAEQEFNHPYFLQTDQNSKPAYRSHLQLRNSQTTGIREYELGLKFQFNQGIFIDIFPVDSIPDNDEVKQKLLDDISYFNRKVNVIKDGTYNYKSQWKKSKPKTTFNYLYNKLRNRRRRITHYYELLEQASRSYNNQPTKRVAKLCLMPIKERRIWQREWLEETKYLPFEMFSIPVPGNYEAVLDKFYGDWREFVVGTATHGGIFLDTDKSYTEYISSKK